MSLSRHFQFVLSQNEASACRRFADYIAVTNTTLERDDVAHVRNVLDRLVTRYEQSGGVDGVMAALNPELLRKM